jgi:hypothetical protein
VSKVAIVLAATVALFAIAPAAIAENVSAKNGAAVGPPYKPATETLRQKQSGGERSIIIVSGKNSKSGSIGSPGSKVMLNPQPLPPKAR